MKYNEQRKMVLLIYSLVNIWSNRLGEIGQQISRSWGDMIWVNKTFEIVISRDMRNLSIVTVWLNGYKKKIRIYLVRLTSQTSTDKKRLTTTMRNVSSYEFKKEIGISNNKFTWCRVLNQRGDDNAQFKCRQTSSCMDVSR